MGDLVGQIVLVEKRPRLRPVEIEASSPWVAVFHGIIREVRESAIFVEVTNAHNHKIERYVHGQIVVIDMHDGLFRVRVAAPQ